MSGYQLDVTRLPVRVVDARGESYAADVFLRPSGEHRPGPETLGDRLNGADARFLPVERDGRVELVSLAAVAYVEHSGPLPEVVAHRSLGGRQEPVTILLRTGEELAGGLLYLFTSDSARVLDRLNASHDPFLLLVSGDLARYVNADAVVTVRF